MYKSIFFIKPEALIVCKICRQPHKVSAPEITLDKEELKNISEVTIKDVITNRQKIDGWHHDYCPRCTFLNAAQIAEEEYDEQI